MKEPNGKVIGLVDVMDLVSHSAGGEGGKGWRDFFKGAIEARGDGSDTASDRSDSVASTSRTKGRKAGSKASTEFDRPVSKLRPKMPTTAEDSTTIYEIATKMAASRADVALLLDFDRHHYRQ